MQTKKEQLRKIIIDLIEDKTDVLELKLGCYVITNNPDGEYGIVTSTSFSNVTVIEKTTDLEDQWWQQGVYAKEHIKQILGRPLHLEDVLLAINKKKKPDEHYAISTNGLFLEREEKEITARPYSKRMVSTLCRYNLTQPFDNQSEELYDFLLEILK